VSPTRKDGQETRVKLLEAASRMFAANGYWKTRLADICREAKANVAAANYHFRSKDSLYIESWKYAFDKSLEKHPIVCSLRPGIPAETNLKTMILSSIRRVRDPLSYDLDIVHQESTAPTGLLEGAIAEKLLKMRNAFDSVVAEMLGADATRLDVRLCSMSIHAQCFGLLIKERRDRKFGGPGRPIEDVDDLTLAKHITRFSLGGIEAVRASLRPDSRRPEGQTRPAPKSRPGDEDKENIV
jgi:AcrR family transcriptional regulator